MRNYLEIDLDILNYNLKKLTDRIDINKIMAVVKADAYGHGLEKVVKKLIKLGVNKFGVATLDEAKVVYSINKNVFIHIFGIIEKEEYKNIEDTNIRVTVSDFETLNYLKDNKLKNKIHIKLDTGMTRLGFNVSDFEKIKQYTNLINIEGVFTHLSSAETDYNYTKLQLEQFDEVVKDSKLLKHALNSAGFDLFHNSKYTYDIVRIGISLYGGEDNTYSTYKPLMKFYSRVVQVKKMQKDSFVSYNKTYLSKTDELLAVLSTGYADGLNRKLSNNGYVYKNKMFPIVGTVCMDMSMIKVDNSIHIGDYVEIFGNAITILDVAKQADTINYEIMTSINKRVPRIYKGEK